MMCFCMLLLVSMQSGVELSKLYYWWDEVSKMRTRILERRVMHYLDGSNVLYLDDLHVFEVAKCELPEVRMFLKEEPA